jgi:hypothetical protein
LDLLGFIRPNRGFSKGYKQKNKNPDSRLRLYAKRLKAIPHPVLHVGLGPEAGSIRRLGRKIAPGSIFSKKMSVF